MVLSPLDQTGGFATLSDGSTVGVEPLRRVVHRPPHLPLEVEDVVDRVVAAVGIGRIQFGTSAAR